MKLLLCSATADGSRGTAGELPLLACLESTMFADKYQIATNILKMISGGGNVACAVFHGAQKTWVQVP